MKYNYINGEVTSEKDFITDGRLVMLQDGWYNTDVIPSVRIPEYGTIWYLQQGMTLFLIKETYRSFQQPLINYVAIEQEVKRNEMAIKEIHSAIKISDDDKLLLTYYSTSKEKESIRMNVQDILSNLKFIKEDEIEYLCNKIDEFFTKPVEESKQPEQMKLETEQPRRKWSNAAKEVEYEGKTYSTISEMFKALDISKQSYYGHIQRNGLTHEEAVKKCIEYRDRRNAIKNYNGTKRTPNSKTYTYLGEKLRLIDLSRLSGIAADTIAARLENGWSVEEAVETPVRPRVKKK